MPADYPEERVYDGLDAVKKELEKLNSKVDGLIKAQELGQLRTEYSDNFILKSQSRVVWWSKVNDAARYRIVLKINIDNVASIDLDRETRYYVFDKLPKGLYCSAKVIAEDREGKEIGSATIKL